MARLGETKATKKSRKRMMAAEGLLITSMLDIIVTVLFFLLKNYSYVVTNFNVADDLQLPKSTAIKPPPDSSLNLIVSKKGILLDDRQLVTFENGKIPRGELYRDGVTIVKLAQALQQHKKRSQRIERQNEQHSFTGLIVLQADQSLKYELLKKVIYTAGIADFVNLKLAVVKPDSA